jgi:putrescine---pyruvate transaminase
VIENAAERGTQIYDGYMELMKKYNVIGDVRGGHGLMTAMEMVRDRATKKLIDGGTAQTVQEVAYQNGAMVRVSGPNLILSPPLVLTEADATTILTALDSGFAAI